MNQPWTLRLACGWAALPVTKTGNSPYRRLKRLTVMGAGLIGLALVFPWHLGLVQGVSMTPTLQPGALFLYERAALKPDQLRRGEIVVLRRTGETWIKRVYARAGERILLWYENDGETIQRFPLATADAERFEQLAERVRVHSRIDARVVALRIPPGQVYLLGDSPESIDSRALGPIDAAQIIGRVIPLPGQDLGLPAPVELSGGTGLGVPAAHLQPDPAQPPRAHFKRRFSAPRLG